MKKVSFLVILVTGFLCSMSLLSQEFLYVGADKCKICHRTEKQGKQHPIWEESKHAKSYTALLSEEAMALAENAAENPACLKCHAPLHEKEPFLKEEGVSCEVCHGPGSNYKSLNVMKNREEAVRNGLILYESMAAIEKHCLTCHQNAHDKPFDFASSWEKIKHPKPEE